MTALASQVDPSRTALERRALAAEMTRRFDALRKAVWALLVIEDGLDLGGPLTVNEEGNPADRILHNPDKPSLQALFDTVHHEQGRGSWTMTPAEAAPHNSPSVLRGVVHPETGEHSWGSAHTYSHWDLERDPKARYHKLFAMENGAIIDANKGTPHHVPGIGSRLAPGRKVVANVLTNALWSFRSSPEKLDAFKQWLHRQINLKILETRTASGLPSLKKPWLAPRIISAYRKGVARAYLDARKKDPYASEDFLAGAEARHLEAVLSVQTSKIQLLYTRAYEDLAGVTADMATKLGRLLATGMINGDSPNAIARKMAAQIGGISLRRARLIARTEIVHAHAEGTLDGLEALGIKTVGALVEFESMRDDKVCPRCKRLDGKRFTIAQARGRIPVHPLCRCAWVPVK